MTLSGIALIAVENCAYSFDNLYSYLIPDELIELLSVGSRVMVPFGNSSKLRQGFVFDIAYENSESILGLKSISHLLDAEPLLSDEMIKLAKWLRDRCFCSYFVAAKSLLPGGMCLKTEKIYSCSADIDIVLYNSLSLDEKLIIDYLRKSRYYITM